MRHSQQTHQHGCTVVVMVELLNAAAGVCRAWGARRTTPIHHCSSETVLGMEARAAGPNPPWVLRVGSSRCWGASTPLGRRGCMPQSRPRKVPLGELLRQAGLLTAEQLTQVLTAQHTRRPAVPFGQLCLELGLVSAAQLGRSSASRADGCSWANG